MRAHFFESRNPFFFMSVSENRSAGGVLGGGTYGDNHVDGGGGASGVTPGVTEGRDRRRWLLIEGNTDDHTGDRRDENGSSGDSGSGEFVESDATGDRRDEDGNSSGGSGSGELVEWDETGDRRDENGNGSGGSGSGSGELVESIRRGTGWQWKGWLRTPAYGHCYTV